MRRELTTTFFLSALVGSALGQRNERGVMLNGDLLLEPAAEQRLAGGWRIVADGGHSDAAVRIELRALAEMTLEGERCVGLESTALRAANARLRLVHDDGGSLEIGELQLAMRGEHVALRSFGADLNGRAVLTLAPDREEWELDSDGQFAWCAEVELDAELAHDLGAREDERLVLGVVTLLGTPYFGSARALVSSSPPPPSTVGPDVIVSGVGLTVSKLGSLNGVSSYSMTTVACNIGDADASWIDCTSGANCNRHPVIGQQMYRLKNVAGSTRFEQLGLSWLKHGFCADDAPNCGAPYTPNLGCDWLGLFATDTYSYAMNGSQPGLGARSEVQPWTGVFPYPPVLGAGQSGDVLYKRLRVPNSDLDPAANPGARYFGEIVYITADEAQNAVRHNNYSTRELGIDSFFAGGWLLNFVAATTPQVSAIERWAQVDPGVRITVVDTPNDGRFLLGAKVTDLGTGQFHYEYALFNMNSDRAGARFTVPFPIGSNVTNVGFHDVDRHSGEPYDASDWNVISSAGANLTWATTPHAQNPNANALRWSTTYSFRFDSDAPPTNGAATLGLFKPGSPNELVIATDVPSGSTCAATNECTAGISSGGCTPSMSLTGAASATQTAPALLAASAVDGQRTGLIFVGFQAANIPWAPASSSTLCIAPPTARIPPSHNSGGTAGVCDGVLSVDVNAYVQSTAGTLLGQPVNAGLVCRAQAWFRDPPAPRSTNLSDALVFSFCP